MDWPSAALLTAHHLLLLLLCAYGAHRLLCIGLALRGYRANPIAPPPSEDALPCVTVQLPLYNERLVAERLLRAAAALDYPRHKLQIQVLDDSTDATVELVAALVLRLRGEGCWIEHVRRPDRSNFKAGALAHAMHTAQGELIAIFDADFVPAPDFLQRTIPHFADPAIGMVQTRWGHLNREESLLTKVQAILLDAHFAVEQAARCGSGMFFNFNGTAGVWRARAIHEAGGWQGDTLTEDLDLSYRAQLAGWRFSYLRDVECAGELPSDMNAFKSQQHRWSKGAIEVMRKLLPRVWAAPISLPRKLEATAHLSSNLSYLILFFDSVFLLFPSILIRNSHDIGYLFWLDLPLFVFASLSHVLFFLMGQKILYGRVIDKLIYAPALLATSVGLALNNGRAVLEALAGHRSAFVRTPKRGGGPAGAARAYAATRTRWSDPLEFALGVFYTLLAIWAWLAGAATVSPFLALFAAGFFYSSLASVGARRLSA